MRMSWKLGRVAGIDIYLHPSFLLVLMFPQVTEDGLFGLALVLAGFGCVLLHELGHALMARRYGIGTEDITLSLIGGVARLTRMPRSPGAELAIALAGPAVNFAIVAGLVGLGLAGGVGGSVMESVAGQFFVNLVLVNLVLGLFNLIPAFPMDGGRVLRAVLSGWLGRLRATTIAPGIGRGLAVLFGTYCLMNGLWAQLFLSVFIFMAAGAELARVSDEEEERRDGDWSAPPGFRWVDLGRGVWRLTPVAIRVEDGPTRRWR